MPLIYSHGLLIQSEFLLQFLVGVSPLYNLPRILRVRCLNTVVRIEGFHGGRIYWGTADPVDLAGKLEQPIINEDIRTEYGNLARDRCLRLYDTEKAIDKYEEVYKFLLAR